MKVLIVGKTAREHAFIEKLSQSYQSLEIFCVPANPAIAEYATCVNINIDDIVSICEFAKENEIDLTVVLDEYAIQKGITNLFRENNLRIFAPTKEAAQIATSRAFSKKFIYKHKIPTPKYAIYDKENTALDYLKNVKFPIVVKYDHLAHQDSFICQNYNQARKVVSEVFEQVQRQVIIEEFEEGEEIVFSILTDGYNVLPFPYVKLYTRVLDGDGGALTKGVGAYTPTTKVNQTIENAIAQNIVFPLLDAMQENDIAYEGFLSVKVLIKPNGSVKALEFLPTLGILEAATVLPLLEDDLFDVINAASVGALEDGFQSLQFSDDASVSVALMSGSYPDKPKTDEVIEGIEKLDEDNIELFYNEVGMNSYYEVVTTGAIPFVMTSIASTLNKARENLYENIDTISYKGKNYRKDIAKIPILKEF